MSLINKKKQIKTPGKDYLTFSQMTEVIKNQNIARQTWWYMFTFSALERLRKQDAELKVSSDYTVGHCLKTVASTTGSYHLLSRLYRKGNSYMLVKI